MAFHSWMRSSAAESWPSGSSTVALWIPLYGYLRQTFWTNGYGFRSIQRSRTAVLVVRGTLGRLIPFKPPVMFAGRAYIAENCASMACYVLAPSDS